MEHFIVRGDHPILKRIDWKAEGLDDLNMKISELVACGYEIKIIPMGATSKIDDELPF